MTGAALFTAETAGAANGAAGELVAGAKASPTVAAVVAGAGGCALNAAAADPGMAAAGDSIRGVKCSGKW